MPGEIKKGSADALAELRSRAAPVIERAPLPILEVQGSDHIVSYVNSAFCSWLGKTREELLGKPFAEIVCGGNDCIPILNKVYQTGQAATLAREDDSDPNAAYWLYAMWPALDEDERPAGVIIQLTKAAKLRQTAAEVNEALLISGLRQHELTEAAEKLNEQLKVEIAERKKVAHELSEKARLLDLSNDAIIVRDLEGRILYWNHGAEELYGWSREEALGKSIHSLLGTEFPKPLKQIIEELHQNGRWTGELVQTKRTGQRITVLARKALDRDSQGKPSAVLENITDITERIEAREALKKIKEQLDQHSGNLEKEVVERTAKLRDSIKSLESLTYTMAHDLRAPIRAMKSLTSVLMEDVPLNEEGRSYAERINTAAERMDQLVNALLDYGQLTHLEFPVHALDLKAQVKRTLDTFSEDIMSSGAEIEVREPLPAVKGNHTLLDQILSNLLGNALKFITPAVKPKILFRAETRGSMVRLWVEDNGIGIAPDHQDKIFGVFQRLHTTEQFPGTGVGLAIARRAAERMNGAAGVESEPGNGSRFWVEIPKA